MLGKKTMSFQPPPLPLVPPLPSSLPPPLPPPPPEQRSDFAPPLPTDHAPPLPTGYAPPLPTGYVPPPPPGQAPPLPPVHAPSLLPVRIPSLPPGRVPSLFPGRVPPLPPGLTPPKPPGRAPLLPPPIHTPPIPPGHAIPLPPGLTPPLPLINFTSLLTSHNLPSLIPSNHPPLLLPGHTPTLHPQPTSSHAQEPCLLSKAHPPGLLATDYRSPTATAATGRANIYVDRAHHLPEGGACTDTTPTIGSSNSDYHGNDSEHYLPTQECVRWPSRDEASKSWPAPDFSEKPHPQPPSYNAGQSLTASFNSRPNMLNRDLGRKQSLSNLCQGGNDYAKPQPLFRVGPRQFLSPHLRPRWHGDTLSSHGAPFASDFQGEGPLDGDFPSVHDGPGQHGRNFPRRDAPRPLFGASRPHEGEFSPVPPPSFRHPPHDCPPPGMFDSPEDLHPFESQERPHLPPGGPHPFESQERPHLPPGGPHPFESQERPHLPPGGPHLPPGGPHPFEGGARFLSRDPRFQFDRPCQPYEGPASFRGNQLRGPAFRDLQPYRPRGRPSPPHHLDRYDYHPYFHMEQDNDPSMAYDSPPKPHPFRDDDIPPLFPDHGEGGGETQNDNFAQNYPEEDYGYEEDDYGSENPPYSYLTSRFAGDEDFFEVNLQHDQYNQHDRYHQYAQDGQHDQRDQYHQHDQHSQHDRYSPHDLRGQHDRHSQHGRRDIHSQHDHVAQHDGYGECDIQCSERDEQGGELDDQSHDDHSGEPDQQEERRQKAAFAAGREDACDNGGWDGQSNNLCDNAGLLRPSNFRDCSGYPKDDDRNSDRLNLTSDIFREGVQRYLSEKALLDRRDHRYHKDLRQFEDEPHRYGDGPHRYHNESYRYDNGPGYNADDRRHYDDEWKRFRRDGEMDLHREELYRHTDLSHQHSRSEYRELHPHTEQDDHTNLPGLSRSEVPPMEVPMPLPEARVVPADQIFDPPGRSERPSHIVVILRGLPGSGKSYIAKLIKGQLQPLQGLGNLAQEDTTADILIEDQLRPPLVMEKETNHGGQPPRILALDTYFVNEVEKMKKDPITGRRVKCKVEEYEYDAALEPSFRKSMFKIFNKTLEEGFFPLIIVDAVNHKIKHFDRFWSSAKMKGFEVYIVDIVEEVGVCAQRNTHNWTRAELDTLAGEWEDTPVHFLRLDVVPLLSDSSNIPEIEMEGTATEVEKEEELEAETDPDSPKQTDVAKSRWEDASDDKLDKLDAVRSLRKRKRLVSDEEEERGELSLTEYLMRKMNEEEVGSKKKRVRWADLEAIKEAEEIKKMGFVMGSGWTKPTEEETHKLLMGDTTDQS